MLELKTKFFVNPDSKKVMELRQQAKEVRNEDPNKAIELLGKAARIEEKRGRDASYIRLEIVKILFSNKRIDDAMRMLQAEYDAGGNRLEIATILYSNGYADDAEQILLSEYSEARKIEVGKAEIKAAEKAYKDRIKSERNAAKFMGEKMRESDLKRQLNEFPDFHRNLLCKAVYEKLRIFYEQTKQYEKAVPWALAGVYAEYENRVHVLSMYGDPISPDFKPVLRCLKKCKREAEMPDLEKIFWEYAKNPDCSMCWRMIDEQFTQ